MSLKTKRLNTTDPDGQYYVPPIYLDRIRFICDRGIGETSDWAINYLKHILAHDDEWRAMAEEERETWRKSWENCK